MKRCILLLMLSPLFIACEDDITVENLPGRVTSVGPVDILDAENGKVGVQFTVRDPEGDDVPILFEVCEEEECGIAQIDAALSDPIARIPSVPKDTDVPHLVVWDANCGSFIEDSADTFTLTEATPGNTYRARLSVVDEEGSEVESADFVLDATLDADACSR